MSDDVSTSIRLPTFNGKEENFAMWWIKFQAFATVKNFREALSDDNDMPLSQAVANGLDTKDSKNKPALKAVTRNNVAMAQLTMAFETQALLSLTDTIKNSDWPGGLATKLVEKLKKKYRPSDRIAAVQLKRKLNKLEMGEYDDPSILFEKIATIENEYSDTKSALQEEDKLALVLEKAPDKYASTLAIIQESKGDQLTIDDLERAMTLEYRLRTKGSKVDGKGKELSLSSFNGICYKCKQSGHKANACPNGKGEGGKGKFNGKFNGKCNLCGKQGHKANDCWENNNNKDKRPKWYKAGGDNNGTEKGLAASNNNESNSGTEFMFMTANVMAFGSSDKLLQDPNVFIADTGATSDTTPHFVGFSKVSDATEKDSITDASGTSISGRKVGNIKGAICDKYGNEVKEGTIRDIVHMPDSSFNLFSLTKRLNTGWTLGGNSEKLWIEKDGTQIVFDIKIKTPKGAIYCMYFKREIAVSTLDSKHGKSVSEQLGHDIMGHMNTPKARESLNYLGYEIIKGSMKPCVSCAEAKAKQRGFPMQVVHHSKPMDNISIPKKAGEEIGIDLSTIKAPKDSEILVSKPNWRMIADKRTGIKFSGFYETKNGMVEPTCQLIDKWKQEGNEVKKIRCDNGGENIGLKSELSGSKWKLNPDFEFTARDTPQQNSRVEVGIYTIARRGIAMMINANVPKELRYKLWREAYTAATLLDSLVIIELDEKKATRIEHWGKPIPAFAYALRTWGEAGVVKTKSKRTAKLDDRGVTCMMVGYSTMHAINVYRMWDPLTERVHISRDILWLKRMYFETNRNKEISANENGHATVVGERIVAGPDADEELIGQEDMPRLINALEINSEDGESDVGESNLEDSSTVDPKVAKKSSKQQLPPVRITRFGRKTKVPKALREDMGLMSLTKAEKEYQEYCYKCDEQNMSNEDLKIDHELAGVGAGVGGGFTSTKELKVIKYDEAVASNDKDEWQEAIKQEHQRMVDKKVWQPVHRFDVPDDAKIMSSTWAMKKKSNGTYRARLNARGYEQIDGEHYDGTSIHAPVTNDTTVRIVMVLGIMASWASQIVDVQGAFLNGNLDANDKLYMEVPQGFEAYYEKENDIAKKLWESNMIRKILRKKRVKWGLDYIVLLLMRAIYGTKQAAMAFWKELLECMRDMKYERSGADPCMYFKWTAVGLIIWLSWIDDCMMWGNEPELLEEKKDFMSRFDCDDVGELKEYVGCKIERNEDSIRFTQPVLIQSFTDEFEVSGKEQMTPAEAGQVLVRNTDPKNVVSKERHHYYRSGVGKLLHLTRWSRPEIQNSVREVARQGSSPVLAHVKALHRVMEHCLATPNRGWLLKPVRKWNGRDKDFEFVIRGQADSDYAKCPVTRRSVSGCATFLEGAPVNVRSLMQKIVALSVTEAETISAVTCAQDMLYVRKILVSLGLKVKLPMVLDIDNSGAVDLSNNWSAGGRTRHMEVRMFFLRDLKEQGLIVTNWINGNDNPVDLFTKNLARRQYEKCIEAFVGRDEYFHYGNEDGNDKH